MASEEKKGGSNARKSTSESDISNLGISVQKRKLRTDIYTLDLKQFGHLSDADTKKAIDTLNGLTKRQKSSMKISVIPKDADPLISMINDDVQDRKKYEFVIGTMHGRVGRFTDKNKSNLLHHAVSVDREHGAAAASCIRACIGSAEIAQSSIEKMSEQKNSYGNTPAMLSIKSNEAFDAMINASTPTALAKTNSQGNSLLHLLAMRSDAAIVNDYHHRTEHAIAKMKQDSAALGSTINKRNNDGYTPLMIALEDGLAKGNFDVANIIMSAPDIDMHKKDRSGHTPLELLMSGLDKALKDNEPELQENIIAEIKHVVAHSGFEEKSRVDMRSAGGDLYKKNKGLRGLQKKIEGHLDSAVKASTMSADDRMEMRLKIAAALDPTRTTKPSRGERPASVSSDESLDMTAEAAVTNRPKPARPLPPSPLKHSELESEAVAIGTKLRPKRPAPAPPERSSSLSGLSVPVADTNLNQVNEGARRAPAPSVTPEALDTEPRSRSNVPLPPPPPPLPSVPAASRTSPSSSIPNATTDRSELLTDIRKGTQLRSVSRPEQELATESEEGKSTLLAQIRKGIQLKNVGEPELANVRTAQKKQTGGLLSEVTEVMQKRRSSLGEEEQEEESARESSERSSHRSVAQEELDTESRSRSNVPLPPPPPPLPSVPAASRTSPSSSIPRTTTGRSEFQTEHRPAAESNKDRDELLAQIRKGAPLKKVADPNLAGAKAEQKKQVGGLTGIFSSIDKIINEKKLSSSAKEEPTIDPSEWDEPEIGAQRPSKPPISTKPSLAKRSPSMIERMEEQRSRPESSTRGRG